MKLFDFVMAKVLCSRVMKRKFKFPIVVERDEDGWLVATVQSLKGCHTQAKDFNTLQKRIVEAIRLCLSVEGRKNVPQTEFVGVFEIAA